MPPLKRRAYIDYLVSREHPPRLLVDINDELSPAPRLSPLERAASHRARTEYKAALEDLPLEKLRELARAACGEHEPEPVIIAAGSHLDQFYNRPEAWADFSNWVKRDLWSLEEATALALGREPKTVSWKGMRPRSENSPVAKEYGRVREMIRQARAERELQEPTSPKAFVKWANSRGLSLPAELTKHPAILEALIDWKAKAQELVAAFNEEYAVCQAQIATVQDGLAEAEAEIADLRTQLAQSHEAMARPKQTAGAENPSVRIQQQNMLKIIYVMAKSKRYRFVPNQRSDAVTRIMSDLQLEGLDLSDDTIRRVLKMAWEASQKEKNNKNNQMSPSLTACGFKITACGHLQSGL